MSNRCPFAAWQEQVLHLPSALKLDDCERIRWSGVLFPGQAVLVDASALEAVDSIGVAALLRLHALAKAQNVNVTWRGIGEQLRALIQVYELDNTELFTCKNN
ncbi:STAS domain-containing protein [Suttonella sp. R2A3]|uniref:STAS domain-containing protein n=1 Tax=Suttonella sp. R2A3 TaxID=2908648 RepID=UPI001F28B224|nr:STAS domain-containing protein [Suttonella sp. R2A3]UJF24557.1 STAS domain-containing protein [Suttonella sp. R2A3]